MSGPGIVRRRRVAAVLVALGLSAPLAAAAPASAQDLNTVQSFDGTPITFYWFPAQGLATGQQAPTVLQGPGFGGKAASDPDATSDGAIPGVGDLRREGYNVLTWNPRGISPSGGAAQLNNPDFEGRDVSALISWVAQRPEAQLDAPGDPRLGMTGGSYGGGIQFSTAAIDPRVDAIVPVIAWNSLRTSLYKASTIKTSWVNALVTLGSRPGNTFDKRILKGRTQASKSTTFSKDIVEFARAAGPDRVLSRITAPTLILQGTIDNLFPPSEAIANYRALRKAGVPTKMVWYCGGHGICLTHDGDQSLPQQQTWLWLSRYLKGDAAVDTGPGFTWVDQSGRYRSAPEYPKPTGTLRAKAKGTLALRGRGGSGPYPGDLPVTGVGAIFIRPTIPGPAKRAVDVRVTSKSKAVVVGTPKLRLTYKGAVPKKRKASKKVRVVAQLVDNRTRTVVGNQVTPIVLRLDGKTRRASVDLEAVSASLRKGQRLTLQIAAQSSLYDVFPRGGSVRFSRIAVTLPTVG
jgi:ABC-2 type transport system ATP-binding protein